MSFDFLGGGPAPTGPRKRQNDTNDKISIKPKKMTHNQAVQYARDQGYRVIVIRPPRVRCTDCLQYPGDGLMCTVGHVHATASKRRCTAFAALPDYLK